MNHDVLNGVLKDIEAKAQARVDYAYAMFTMVDSDKQKSVLRQIEFHGELTEKRLKEHLDDLDLIFDALDELIPELEEHLRREASMASKH